MTLFFILNKSYNMKKLLFAFFIIINSLFAQGKPYAVLVSIDAFRWDYINRGLTPALSEIKDEGVSAISLQSVFPSKTFPNHQSIITGMYAQNHGIISNDFENLITHDRYRMSDTNAVRDGKWYLGEAFWETAKRNGIVTASYYWPGSEIENAQRRPDYFKPYKKGTADKEKLDQFLKWLTMPQEKRPHFITLYFEQVDTRTHQFGPNSSEANDVIKQVDGVIAQLKNNIEKAGLKDSVNLIILSDHGMTEVSKNRAINIEQIINNPKCRIVNTGPVGMIEAPADIKEAVYNNLKKNENHYKVYYKEEVPEYYHYSKNPFITDIVVIADLGWELRDERGMKRMENGNGIGGDHGFDNHQLDMQGFFVAEGPAFKVHYATGTLWNIDVYPLLCKIFNIQPRSNIDGKLDRIGFLLK